MAGRKTRNIFRIVILLIPVQLTFLSCSRSLEQTESFSDIFDHYRDKPGIVAISFPPGLISLVMDKNAEDENDLISLFKDLSVFRMLLIEQDSSFGERKVELDGVIRDFTIRNDFVYLLDIENTQEKIMIKIREKKDIIREAIILVSGQDTFVAINLRGNIKPKHLSHLASTGELLKIVELQNTDFP